MKVPKWASLRSGFKLVVDNYDMRYVRGLIYWYSKIVWFSGFDSNK